MKSMPASMPRIRVVLGLREEYLEQRKKDIE